LYTGGRNVKKGIVAMLATLALLAGAASVFAEDATVTVSGGSLSVTAAAVALSGITLDGSDQTATSAFGSNSWTAEDATGSGSGWNVTIIADDFSDGGTETIDISQADQEFKIQVEDANITVISGNTKPTTSVASLTAIDNATPLKIVSAAADEGMGEYNIPPAFELEVPSETAVGSYTSTMTIAVNSGP
jgi:hypothetical protein